jgi:type I restriction enzyme S subunit
VQRSQAMCFGATRGEIETRADVNYTQLLPLVRERLDNAAYPTVPLGSLLTLVQYGSSTLATTKPSGVPIVRMNNLQQDGWALEDLKYVTLPAKEVAAYRLEPGDLLFNRTNSKDLVGKCEVFREPGEWVFASYLIRVRTNPLQADPQFVSDFLNAPTGRLQIDCVSRQIVGMTNVNSEEIKDFRIPLPPLSVQQELVAAMNAARSWRQNQLAEADELLSSFDDYMLDKLGLPRPEPEPRAAFAIKLSQLTNGRLDPCVYQPLFASSTTPDTPLYRLDQLAFLNEHSLPKSDDAELVPYVGLPECTLTEIREVATRSYREVRGRSIVKKGDILFARIEPSVFNKKYVLVENLHGYDAAYTSTEFYVITPRPHVSIEYLYALLFCSFVFAQTKGKTTGSSGRRRLDPDSFAALQIPLPSIAVQQEVANEMSRRRAQARELRVAAEAGWAAAKQTFENTLLATS